MLFDEDLNNLVNYENDVLLKILSDVCLCLGKCTEDNSTFDFWYSLYKFIDNLIDTNYSLEE